MRFNTIHVCLTVPGAIIPTSNHADIQTLNLPVINTENTMGFNYESVAINKLAITSSQTKPGT